MNRHPRIAATLTAVALGGMLLSGCSSDSGQTTDEACALLEERVPEVTADYTDQVTELMSAGDYDGYADVFGELIGDLSALSDEISNDEVKESWTSLLDISQKATESSVVVMEDPTTEVTDDMQSLAAEAQAAQEDFVALCPNIEGGFTG